MQFTVLLGYSVRSLLAMGLLMAVAAQAQQPVPTQQSAHPLQATVASAQPPAPAEQAAAPAPADFDTRLEAIKHGWAEAKYQTESKNEKIAKFSRLAGQAQALAQAFPQRGEALVWEGAILASQAATKGGLGALGLAKKSRATLERAEKLDPQMANGFGWAVLAAIYGKVPGKPIGFGDDKLAAQYFQKALSIDPKGIDPNFYYGEYLLDEKRNSEAATYLQRALRAVPRPGREDADKGRREEAQRLLDEAKGGSAGK